MSGQPTPEQINAALAERNRSALEAWEKKDIDAIFSRYDDNVKYTDFGLGVHDLDKKALRTFLEDIFQGVEDLKMESISYGLSHDYKRWTGEHRMTFKYVKDVKAFPEKATGKEVVVHGGSFAELGGEKGAEKATKIHHYCKYTTGMVKLLTFRR